MSAIIMNPCNNISAIERPNISVSTVKPPNWAEIINKSSGPKLISVNNSLNKNTKNSVSSVINPINNTPNSWAQIVSKPKTNPIKNNSAVAPKLTKITNALHLPDINSPIAWGDLV